MEIKEKLYKEKVSKNKSVIPHIFLKKLLMGLKKKFTTCRKLSCLLIFYFFPLSLLHLPSSLLFLSLFFLLHFFFLSFHPRHGETERDADGESCTEREREAEMRDRERLREWVREREIESESREKHRPVTQAVGPDPSTDNVGRTDDAGGWSGA
jgi:hypothetical protein